MKVLFGMVLRQTTGFVESLLQLIDVDYGDDGVDTTPKPCRNEDALYEAASAAPDTDAWVRGGQSH